MGTIDWEKELQRVRLSLNLHKFQEANKQHIESIYLVDRIEWQLFVVVMRQFRYNEELEDSLTELDIEVANDPQFDKLKLSVIVVPKGSVRGNADLDRLASIVSEH